MIEQSEARRRTARIFGVLFGLTFVTAIAGLLLYDPVLNDADYVLGDGADRLRGVDHHLHHRLGLQAASDPR